jgi:hypothetical protein
MGIYLSEELPPIRVAPDRRFLAEVVVLVTTLGVKRDEFNASNRARDLLEIFKCHFKVIDFNLDTNVEVQTASSRVNQADLEVIRTLYAQKKLMQDPTDGLIVLPQILVDSVNIGDFSDLQALADEGVLERILLRELCPKCLRSRKETKCRFCDEVFQELMPSRHTIEDTLASFPPDN